MKIKSTQKLLTRLEIVNVCLLGRALYYSVRKIEQLDKKCFFKWNDFIDSFKDLIALPIGEMITEPKNLLMLV